MGSSLYKENSRKSPIGLYYPRRLYEAAENRPRLRWLFREAIAAQSQSNFPRWSVSPDSPALLLKIEAERLRKVGLDRILWSSDQSFDYPAGKQWLFFRALMPLTEEELRKIATNVAPYAR